MNFVEQKKEAEKFVTYFKNHQDEKQDTQQFRTELLGNVFGIKPLAKFIDFEKRVNLGHTSFIDGYIATTKVLIEQKGGKIDLTKAEIQSDGTPLTPYEQAKRYADNLPLSEKPRRIVTCNFKSFFIYDMEKTKPQDEPEELLLENLPKEYHRLNFLVNDQETNIKKEMEISIKAGEIVGKLYDKIAPLYKDIQNEESQKSLNVFCVRLVFCLYAEDAGVFGKKNLFHDYLEKYSAEDLREALINLFKILNQKTEERDPYLKEDLQVFPYVNGGLFANENIEIPRLTEEIKTLLLTQASEDFDRSEISPTIFGAVFESTLNPETRRSGGMHYTSIENIHKVIDPLFLDDLKTELNEFLELKQPEAIRKNGMALQEKLSALTFLDPACGSGNFLTETYLSLRRIENQIIDKVGQGQNRLINPIKVGIHQFYGIEINDFAVDVAKTALWIAEAQMMNETENILGESLDFLPLKTNANIIKGNALRLDRNEVIENKNLNYIIGNPPFIGRRYRNENQQKEISIFFEYKDIDYVACWFYKSAEFIKNTNIKVALVATNSISQGEQVSALWKNLYNQYNININFAHKTFRRDSEANLKAHVHCIIIGFSSGNNKNNKKIIYENHKKTEVKNINGYLLDAPNVFIETNGKPLCKIPNMKNGNVPLDGDALKIEIEDLPKFQNFPYIKRLMGGRELLHNELRYVLRLVGISPNEIKKYPEVYKRVELCRKNRLAMKDKGTQKLANTPTTFRDTNNPDNYIALPMVSSEKREYIPMMYLHGDIIPTNQIQTIPEATIFHFGILTSSTHMARMRAVAGRLEMRYRYSKDIVYNNFPRPTPTDLQKEKIEKTAQAILDARALYPDSSLADLYDELTMPSELRKAHQANDKAVMEAYGFDPKLTESEIVSKLMEMYQRLVE